MILAAVLIVGGVGYFGNQSESSAEEIEVYKSPT